MKYYSAEKNGFFDSKIHGQNMPDDVVQISDQEYQTLLNGQASGKLIQLNDAGKAVLVAPPVEPASDRRLAAKQAIDNAAGNARQRFVSNGMLIDMEYKLAQEQTAAWRAAGSPAEDVPAAIRDWGNAAGMTDEQAAADIEQTAQAWEQVLLTVRQIRLAGKAAVDAGTDQGTATDMADISQPYIDQLDALKP